MASCIFCLFDDLIRKLKMETIVRGTALRKKSTHLHCPRITRLFCCLLNFRFPLRWNFDQLKVDKMTELNVVQWHHLADRIKFKSHLFSPAGSVFSSLSPHRELENFRGHAKQLENHPVHNRNLFAWCVKEFRGHLWTVSLSLSRAFC